MEVLIEKLDVIPTWRWYTPEIEYNKFECLYCIITCYGFYYKILQAAE